mgnify:CR=1 FL=1
MSQICYSMSLVYGSKTIITVTEENFGPSTINPKNSIFDNRKKYIIQLKCRSYL